MQLKVTYGEVPKHKDVATCIAWSNVDEVFTCGDDHALYIWNLLSDETVKVADLPIEIFPIAMQWPPKNFVVPIPGARKNTELLLITTSDGYFHLLARGGRIEKSVPAHKGAVISGSWNPEGSEILTSGEDGCVRIWSRNGVMRSCLAQISIPVYSSAWSPDAQSIIHTNGQNLVIKPVASNSNIKPIQWKAHDGIILCISWSSTANLIISGAEDCRYKVWDTDGRQVFASTIHDYPVTSLAWTIAGDLFAVAGFNFLRLCDRYGWSHSLEKPNVGSIYSIQWSSDGTQLVGACASGHVFLANIVERSVSWQNIEAVLIGRRSLTISEFTANTRDRLDFRERISQISLKFGYLLVVSPTQVYIYNALNISTPILCDLRENNIVTLVLQSSRNFLLCGNLAINCWTYTGHQEGTIKWPGLRAEFLNSQTSTNSPDMAAFVDQTDPRLIRIFYTLTGKLVTECRMKHPVQQVALAQMDDTTEKILAIVDKNLELYLMVIRRGGGGGGGNMNSKDAPKRMSMMTHGVIWHSEAPILASLRKTKLRIYYLPQVIFLDSTILEDTFEDRDLGELGPAPQLVSYESGCVQIRRSNGILLSTQTSPFIPHIHQLVVAGKFIECQRICRYVNEKILWGVMAGLAASKGELDLAEVCFGEIGHYDKVFFIQTIKQTPDELTKKSQTYLLTGANSEAEHVLLQQNRFAEAIALHILSHSWIRALELTIKHNEDLEELLIARQLYIHSLNTQEYNPRFLELQSKYKLSPKSIKKIEVQKNQKGFMDILHQRAENEREEIAAATNAAIGGGGNGQDINSRGDSGASSFSHNQRGNRFDYMNEDGENSRVMDARKRTRENTIAAKAIAYNT